MAELVNLQKLAVHIRLPRGWLREEAIAGRIPCLRVGRRMLFNLAAVEQALALRAAMETSVTRQEASRVQ
jgi:hypothetical protein